MVDTLKAQDIEKFVNKTDHKGKPLSGILIRDLENYLSKNEGFECDMVFLDFDGTGNK